MYSNALLLLSGDKAAEAFVEAANNFVSITFAQLYL